MRTLIEVISPQRSVLAAGFMISLFRHIHIDNDGFVVLPGTKLEKPFHGGHIAPYVRVFQGGGRKVKSPASVGCNWQVRHSGVVDHKSHVYVGI